MRLSFKLLMTTGSLLLVSACTTTEVVLPPIDASPAMAGNALVVEANYWRGFSSPNGIIRGSREGALNAVDEYMDALFRSYLTGGGAGGGVVIGVLIAPIALPAAAAIGAAKASSEEDVNSAVKAFNEVGKEEALLRAIDQKFVAHIEENDPNRWSCLATSALDGSQPCQASTPITKVRLLPAITVITQGKYDPTVELFAEIVAIASLENPQDRSDAEIISSGKWVYRDRLGDFFELAENNAVVLRTKLNKILDQFATRIADDLFLNPSPQKLKEQAVILQDKFTNIPEGVVTRVEQGLEVASAFTHGYVAVRITSSCWIESIDGENTGHHRNSASDDRWIPVEAGLKEFSVSCLRYSDSAENHTVLAGDHSNAAGLQLQKRQLQLDVKVGESYETDGRRFTRTVIDRRVSAYQ